MGRRQNLLQICVTLFLVYCTASLSGCTERLEQENADLKKQVAELRHEVDSHQSAYYSRQAEIEYARKVAGQASACDFIFPTCPPSWIAAGHAALQAGYDPELNVAAGGWWLWLLVMLKIALLLAGLYAVFFVVQLAWRTLYLPAKSERESYARIESGLEQRRRDLEKEEQQIQSAHIELTAATKIAEAEVERAYRTRARQIQRALQTRSRIRSLKARLKALDSFK